MPVKLKTTVQQGTVADAISAGFGELQSLKDEMTEWKDNLEEKLSHTDKYERVSECVDSLEEIADCEDECVPEDENYSGIQTSWSEQKKQSKKSPYPRWLRLQNALSAIGAAKDCLESSVEQFDEDLSDAESEVRDTLQNHIDRMEEIIGTAEGVEFPGMYG